MKPDQFIDFTAIWSLSQGRVFYRDLGHHVRNYTASGFIGGVLSNVETDEFGRLYVTSITISSLLGCGHTVTSVDQISGSCSDCGRLCCDGSGCLLVCDLTGKTVCKKHYSVKEGIVVAKSAREGLWRLKVRKLANNRREARANGAKQIPDKT